MSDCTHIGSRYTEDGGLECPDCGMHMTKEQLTGTPDIIEQYHSIVIVPKKHNTGEVAAMAMHPEARRSSPEIVHNEIEKQSKVKGFENYACYSATVTISAHGDSIKVDIQATPYIDTIEINFKVTTDA